MRSDAPNRDTPLERASRAALLALLVVTIALVLTALVAAR